MNRSRLFSTTARTATLAIASLLMVACGNKLSGKYSSRNNGGSLLGDLADMSIEFKSGNKANYTVAGSTIETDYEVSGKEIKLKTPGGTVVGKIGDDGCLDFGGMLGKLCKEGKS